MSVDMMDTGSTSIWENGDDDSGGKLLNDSFQDDDFDDDRESSPKTLIELADEGETKANGDHTDRERDETFNESDTPPRSETPSLKHLRSFPDLNEPDQTIINGCKENNSFPNNGDRRTNLIRPATARKRVGWQSDHRDPERGNDPAAWPDTDNANPSSACVNVGAVGQASPVERAELNASSQRNNKRIKDPRNDSNANNNRRPSCDDGLAGSPDKGEAEKGAILNAGEDKELRDDLVNDTDSRLVDDTSPASEEIRNVNAKEKRARIVEDTATPVTGEDFSSDGNAKETCVDQTASDDLAPDDTFTYCTNGDTDEGKGRDAVVELTIPDLVRDGDHESTPPTTNGAKTDTSVVDNTAYNPALLLKRRPVSANGVWTRSSRFLDSGKPLSEELSSNRPSTSTGAATTCSPFRAHRRLSLQLDNFERVPSDPQRPEQRLIQSDEAKKTDLLPSPKNDSALPVAKDSPVQNGGEKRVRKAALVTYIDPKELNITGEGKEGIKDSNARPDKPPINVPSTKENAEKNTRVRPSTAPSRRGKSNTAAGSNRPRSSASASRPTSSSSAGSRTGEPRLYREMRFTKEELRRALPRRNFYGCHIKALKDAGIQVDEDGDRPRRRRLFNFHHPEEEEESQQPKDKKPAFPLPPVVNVPTGADHENGDEDKFHSLSDGLLETAVGMMTAHERARRRKASMAVQARAVVECKPLQLYLTYVRDNPGEYRHMVAKHATSGAAAALHPSSVAGDNCHTARLVQMGRIFQERQRGGWPRADEVLRAAYSLNPREADPNRFAKPPRDKTPILQGLIARKPSVMPSFQRKETAPPPSVSGGSGGDDAGGAGGGKSGQSSKPGSEVRSRQDSAAAERVVTEPLMEVEKRRLKAEEWARTVTTEQLVTAKLNVLKELGHEERELSQWWIAFKTCYYLRPKIRQ